MDISKSKLKGIKLVLIKHSNELITDVDFFVNYLGYRPELVLMVDIDWDKLPDDVKNKPVYYLKEKYGESVHNILKMLEIPFNGDINFEVMNK
jgi:hypothetical protein